ncbi:hypothetical protein GFS31_41500 (plasmid) [Leptolyngbya sp. BL0902]|uniref:hypothetical protein n=1 Tax=Leptolyngbya sp. BL0902 TaxID=1115757 RepID=UPI0018E6E977|nr:hypothetical protein [Leptolyngbya sp. BL0902]QQE67437.1 hypothetical protein GFS31_41500 [Leptolyngbya sp. BL0902]
MATQTKTRQATKPSLLASLLPYDEKLRLRELAVLRDRVGNELRSKAQFEMDGATFDWTAFRAQFHADYGDLPLADIRANLKTYYGFSNAQDVADAYDKMQELRRARQAQRGY